LTTESNDDRRHPVWLLHGTLLVSGAAVMVIEILGTRILSPYYGLGVQVWAALITVTLISLAVGYWVGGMLADRHPSPALFHGMLVLAGLTTLAMRTVASPVTAAFASMGIEAGALASALVIFGPALFLLGTMTPFACRLHPGRTTRTGSTVGRLYAVSTVGSVIGALLAGFILIPHWPVSRIFQATAILLGITGAIGLIVARRRIGIIAAIVALLGFIPIEGAASAAIFGVTVVRDEQTFYSRVQTVDADGQRWLMMDGLVHTHISLVTPDDAIQCEYVRCAELVPAVRPGARRFLSIGCGGGAMLRLLEGKGRTFDVIDVDPTVIRTAREDFGADVTGATFHVGDGRMFVRNGGTWDAVLLDVVSTEVMPEHLSSVEFLLELKSHLTPDGVVLMNSVGRPDGRVLDSFGRTMRSAFTHVLAFTAHLDERSTNVLWLASDEPLTLPEDLRQAYEWRAYETGDTGVILTDDYNPVNHWNAALGRELRVELHRRFGRAVFEVR
jgi:spermidine synthase